MAAVTTTAPAAAAPPTIIPVVGIDPKNGLPGSFHQTSLTVAGNSETSSPAVFSVKTRAYHGISVEGDKPPTALDGVTDFHLASPGTATVHMTVDQPTTVAFGHVVAKPDGKRSFDLTGAEPPAQSKITALANPASWPVDTAPIFLPPGKHSIDVTLDQKKLSAFDPLLLGHTPESLLKETTVRPSGRLQTPEDSHLSHVLTKYPFSDAEKRVEGDKSVLVMHPDVKGHLEGVFGNHLKSADFAIQIHPQPPVHPYVEFSYPAPKKDESHSYSTTTNAALVPLSVARKIRRTTDEASSAALNAPKAAALPVVSAPKPVSPPIARRSANTVPTAKFVVAKPITAPPHKMGSRGGYDDDYRERRDDDDDRRRRDDRDRDCDRDRDRDRDRGHDNWGRRD